MAGVVQEISVIRDEMVATRDGVKLATDIYLPCSSLSKPNCGRWPVLMERTPYNKRGLNRSERTAKHPSPMDRTAIASWFAHNGYVVVMQDCRGRYGSEGNFTKYINEAEDGYDTLDWVMRQPWCNGKIGMFGVSYGAHTQIAAACLNPPGLKSLFMDSGGFASAYHGGIRRGGAFEMKQVTWAHKHALLSPKTQNDPARKAALEEVVLEDWFRQFPWRKGHSPLAAAPEYEDYLFEQWDNSDYGPYWQQLGISAADHYDHMPDIPVMILNSWYDPYVGSCTANYLGMTQAKTAPTFLTMGPWLHGQRSFSFSGDVDFGEHAVFENAFGVDYLEYRLKWFNKTLKGQEEPLFSEEKPVTLFVMGVGDGNANAAGRLSHGGAWQNFADWPLPEMELQPYYMHSGGLLCPSPPQADANPESFVYDPREPTPTIGGTITSGEPVMIGGAFDQRENKAFLGCASPGRDLKDRGDVLSFSTEPLAKDMVMVGPVHAKLWVSSDCPDTDFVVKLIDVHPPTADFPDGFAMNVTEGILRLRYRNNWSKPEMATPEAVYEIEIQLQATANCFQKGHQIRVDIASSNFPHFDLNPNTGELGASWTNTITALNRVFVDKKRPSYISLPLVSNGENHHEN